MRMQRNWIIHTGIEYVKWYNHSGKHFGSFLKKETCGRAWWQVPVIPATQEAEAGELPETRRRRLWWAKIILLYSSLGDRARLRLKKKERWFHPRLLFTPDRVQCSFASSSLPQKSFFWARNRLGRAEGWWERGPRGARWAFFTIPGQPRRCFYGALFQVFLSVLPGW